MNQNHQLQKQVDHPAHYGGADNPFEPIKIINHYDLGFHLGNVIKYVLRSGKKAENPSVLDLKKARFYLEQEILKQESNVDAP